MGCTTTCRVSVERTFTILVTGGLLRGKCKATGHGNSIMPNCRLSLSVSGVSMGMRDSSFVLAHCLPPHEPWF